MRDLSSADYWYSSLAVRMRRFNQLIVFLLSAQLIGCHTQNISDSSDQYFMVSKVVDGDTFWVDDGSEKGKKVRLIGVDAPETRSSSRKEVGYFGNESKVYLKSLLEGKQVRLDYDVDQTDRYGRTLAYVYLRDGTFINAELIKNGFAIVLTVSPNVRFADEFVALQREARDAQRGLWAKPVK